MLGAFGCLWDDGLVFGVFARAPGGRLGDGRSRSLVHDDMDAQARLVAEVRAIWDAKAAFWDERMGEGNPFQLELIGPRSSASSRCAPVSAFSTSAAARRPSRRLAHLGARVVAIDASSRFLELARSRSPELSDRIDCRLIDATDEEQLTLGKAASTRWCATWC